MADNTTLPGTGDVIATDDIGGVKWQRVKPAIGADGTAVDAVPVVAGMDTTGTGVQSAGMVGQLDDASTAAVTENQFAPVRISSRRALLVEGVTSGTAVAVADSAMAAKFANAKEIAPAATTMSTSPAYTALDQVGTLLTFSACVSANGRACRIESVYFGNKANTAPALQLWLFNASPTLTSPADNAAWQPTDGDMATLVDVIDSGQWFAGAATALNQWSRVAGLGRVVVCAAGDTALYGYLVLAPGGSLTGASTTDLTVRIVVTPDV